MKFEEIAPYLREGKKIRRPIWDKNQWVQIQNGFFYNQSNELGYLLGHEILADDWEIFEETIPPRKFEFEGYIGEDDNTILEEKNSYWHKDAIEDNLKKRCTNIFSKNIFLDPSIWTEEDYKRFPYTKISKWKFTMEELKDES